MTDEPDTAKLENRIDKLESTIEKMMPSRRDALKMGGAALVGGAAMSGTASAGTNQVGTIGSQASPVDLESEDINNSDTVTTENLVVNGTATGVGGGVPPNFNYVDVKGNRSIETTFTNTTGKALFVVITVFTSGDLRTKVRVGGEVIMQTSQGRGGLNFNIHTHTFFVPDGADYKVEDNLDNASVTSWVEAEM